MAYIIHFILSNPEVVQLHIDHEYTLRTVRSAHTIPIISNLDRLNRTAPEKLSSLIEVPIIFCLLYKNRITPLLQNRVNLIRTYDSVDQLWEDILDCANRHKTNNSYGLLLLRPSGDDRAMLEEVLFCEIPQYNPLHHPEDLDPDDWAMLFGPTLRGYIVHWLHTFINYIRKMNLCKK